MHCSVHVTAWIQPFCSQTTVLSLWCLLLHACLCKCLLLLLLLHGERALAGLLLGQLPLGSGAVLHSPAACMLREVSLNLETCTYLSNRKSQQENRESILQSITFHIPLFFTSDPKMSQQWHNSETEKPVQLLPEVFPLPLPFFILATFKGSALCLCTTLTAITNFFKCLSRMHITNRFLLATWTE